MAAADGDRQYPWRDGHQDTMAHFWLTHPIFYDKAQQHYKNKEMRNQLMQDLIQKNNKEWEKILTPLPTGKFYLCTIKYISQILVTVLVFGSNPGGCTFAQHANQICEAAEAQVGRPRADAVLQGSEDLGALPVSAAIHSAQQNNSNTLCENEAEGGLHLLRMYPFYNLQQVSLYTFICLQFPSLQSGGDTAEDDIDEDPILQASQQVALGSQPASSSQTPPKGKGKVISRRPLTSPTPSTGPDNEDMSEMEVKLLS